MIIYLKMQKYICSQFVWLSAILLGWQLVSTKVVEPVGSSEKKQDNKWNSGDTSEAKQEYGIKLAFGIESK
jgi:hypothetical protein